MKTGIATALIPAAVWLAAPAPAEPVPPPPVPVPIGGAPGIGQGPGLGAPGLGGGGPGLSPAAATIFLCPGVGGAANIIGAGGGYCDFDFQTVQLTATTSGVMHAHCEWGGFNPLIEMWNCWRVFPGQPDHPAHPDPDIVPDGFGVPWAILGPSPADQWPPPGLAPAAAFGPPTSPPPPSPPPMFPPWDQPTDGPPPPGTPPPP